jgi:hypothetical protein
VSCLNAAISDRPQPAESLRAAVAWSVGHRGPTRSGSPRCIDRFKAGDRVHPVAGVIRGRHGPRPCGRRRPARAAQWR